MVSSSSPTAKKTPPRKSKTLLLRLFLWLKKFLNERKLPYVANQACRVYFGKEKSSRRKCQSILQTQIELDGQQLKHFLQTSIGDRLLSWLSPLFHFPDQPNAKHGLRQLFLEMAGKQEGISLLQLLQLVPEQTQINLEALLAQVSQIESLMEKTEHLLGQVQAIATAKIDAERVEQFTTLPDLRQRGDYAVQVGKLGDEWGTLYLKPEYLAENTKIIVLSHGLGSRPEDLLDFGKHFASHGYFVVIPHHQGSSSDRLKLMLAGEVEEVFPFSEFGDRPATISAVLDWLTLNNYAQFHGRLNLQNVGVMGHSFGAYTALALAGAAIQFDHLQLACGAENLSDPNISLLLQCQALGMPQKLEHCHDPRVSCICVWDFVGSAMFGEIGLATVQIPVMAIAGSHDITTPFALEQIQLFQWLQTTHPYLAVMQGKPHIQNWRKLTQAIGLKMSILRPNQIQPKQTSFSANIEAISLAFFHTHLSHQTEQACYLTADYGDYLGRSPRPIFILEGQDRVALADVAQV